MSYKRILIITILCILALLYGAIKIYPDLEFARAIAADKSQSEMNRLRAILKDGDLIFQTSTSNQSKAIQLATRSKYSHVGIIYWQGVNLYVYEAVQPVKLTRLSDWIDRGVDRKYVVKRLKNADKILTKENLAKMKFIGEKFRNKNYDIFFEWSDDKMYWENI